MGVFLGKEVVLVVYNGRLIEEIWSLFLGNVLVLWYFVIIILLCNIVVIVIVDDF